MCRSALNKRRRTDGIRTGNLNHDGERVSISRESSTEEVIVLDTTYVGRLGESPVQMRPENMLCEKH